MASRATFNSDGRVIFEGDQLPVAISPSDFPVRDDQLPEIYKRLKADAEAISASNNRRLLEALRQFAADDALQVEADAAPGNVTLIINQPDGSPAKGLLVRLAGADTDDGEVAAPQAIARKPLADGSVSIPLPATWHKLKLRRLKFVVIGGDGAAPIEIDWAERPDHDVLPVALPRPLRPAPMALFESLQGLVEGEDAGGEQSSPVRAVKPVVGLGEGECAVVFGTDTSQDRYPFSLLFRLTDPGLSLSTLAMRQREGQGDDTLRAVFADFPPNLADSAELRLVDRVGIERPISAEAFRRGIAGVATPRRIPIAATLALGYVLRLAQRWTQKGLALGDLVYSLPLAPGEQQRIAVSERRQTASVMEREALEQREDLRFDETDQSSVQATFEAGFAEAARGGSSYEASSSSFSIAAAAGGGGVFPFGAFGGGVATSYGSASASGSTSTWMEGSRRATSNAAQRTQASVSRRATAARSSTRASVRLATATDTTQLTTKVITNHNKTRALTMQYWEVLRLFDVATVIEDATLVALIPIDVVDFLPQGQSQTLGTGALNRDQILARYAKLLEHAEVLRRVVPWRLRRGLAALSDFAANPQAVVASPVGDALTTIDIKVRGNFTGQDQAQVQLLLKNGRRSGIAPLSPVGSTPSPPEGTQALPDEAALFNWFRQQRAGAQRDFVATLVLPQSVGLADVVGLVVRSGFRTLDYSFSPPGLSFLLPFLGGDASAIANAVQKAGNPAPITRSFSASRVAQEIGPLEIYSVSAEAGPRQVADQSFAGGAPVPGDGLVVSAVRSPPELSYEAQLDIERTLQWVLQNTVLCSTNVVASLSPEERAIMLDRYAVVPPRVGDNGEVIDGVPLLSCITNDVLGFYGNAIVVPFQIPAELERRVGVNTAKVQRALRRFHDEAFDHPSTTIALPTRGVLGEAVLGRCPSAEKIDLTRFWNWKDSPGDEATEIAPVTLPQSDLVSGLRAPSDLTSLSPIINNFSTQGPTADSSLASAIAGRAVEFGKSFDVAALTNAGNLRDVANKTTETAESARKDALGAAKEVAIKAMDAAASRRSAGESSSSRGSGSGGTPSPGGAPGGGGTPGGGTPGGGPTNPQPSPPPITPPPAPPAARPATLRNFFNLNETALVDETNEHRAGQSARIADWISAARAYGARRILVRGYASPEGPRDNNVRLVQERAEALAERLRADLPDADVRTAWGGIVDGPPSSEYPELRRADAEVEAP